MVQLLEKSRTSPSTFAVVNGGVFGSATHFIANDGALKTIDHMTDNVAREEPLPLPTLNFGGEDEKQVTNDEQYDGEAPLVLPTMNFDKKKKDDKKVKADDVTARLQEEFYTAAEVVGRSSDT